MVNAGHETAGNPELCVVGVDFGTLSGRAVVVRVRDGAELGTAEHAYRHAVLDRELPDGTRLPPDWALQVPSTTSTCCATRCRRRSRPPVCRRTK